MLDRVVGFFSGSGSTILKTEEGRPVEAVLRQPPGVTMDYAGLSMPRRLILVPPSSSLHAGMVLVGEGNARFLLGQWSSDVYLGEVVAKQFVLLECNAKLSWTRLLSDVDPISGLTKILGQQPLGTIWAVSERRSLDQSAGGFDAYARRVICGADVQPGDSLGDHMVKRVERSQGLIIADVA